MVMSDNDAEQYTTVTVSSQEIHADSGQTKLQPTSNPIFGEGNEDYAGKCATEATQQDALLSEMQGPPFGRGVTEDCSKAIEVDEESSSHCKDKINGLHSWRESPKKCSMGTMENANQNVKLEKLAISSVPRNVSCGRDISHGYSCFFC